MQPWADCILRIVPEPEVRFRIVPEPEVRFRIVPEPEVRFRIVPELPPPKPLSIRAVQARDTWDAAKKHRFWQLFVSRQGPWESKLTFQIRGLFRRQRDQVIERLGCLGPKTEARYAGWSRRKVLVDMAQKATAIDSINIDQAAEMASLQITITPLISTMIEQEGERILQEFGSGMFNVNDPKVLKWLGTRMDQFSREVTGTTFDAIRETLRAGFSEGKPASVIADELRATFASWDKFRAPLIARTETMAGMNRADLLAIEQAKLDKLLKKAWLSAGDEATRPTHLEAGIRYAEGIPLKEYFKVGGDRMLAPGNGSDPGENINCRCCVRYVKMEAPQVITQTPVTTPTAPTISRPVTAKPKPSPVPVVPPKPPVEIIGAGGKPLPATYKQAKTLEEAEKFAKEILGIREIRTRGGYRGSPWGTSLTEKSALVKLNVINEEMLGLQLRYEGTRINLGTLWVTKTRRGLATSERD